MTLRETRSSRLLATVATALVGAGLVAQDAAAPGKSDFLAGLKGFEHFHDPIGQPLYFETPTNDTGIRLLYLRHNFSDNSLLQGGNVTVYALQARVAITERLGLIATKDGYTEMDTGLLGEDEGWNDLAAGVKYVALEDKANDMLVTPGIRLETENGHRGILQGTTVELSPFVSFAKGFDEAHVLANVTLRVPTDQDEGNNVLHWDLHFDYDLNKGADRVFAPTFELHGVHYLSDGDASSAYGALPIGGLDYANLGSNVGGEFVCWAGVGMRMEAIQKVEVGLVYEFALTDPGDDIWKDRITFDFHVRW